ncbi:hypothetical protein AALP_AA8G459300 [Arabis alpina]|uniref:Retrotransposon gag domain-containing protein n=1 Tax=Arabis alpina TaxID=50452 RepID=A0A087GDQ4_ARAAL|nr:hypothetical protein AALP_AA8G459300 [Arabis alpina]
MSPRRQHEPVNEWVELRQTLLAMQENIQATIHDSIQEVVELFQGCEGRRSRSQPRSEADSKDDDNPFAEERSRQRGGGDEYHDRDRRWESGFKIEIPEFHGGVRGEELLDWLAVAEEAMEFKQVPDDRKVALVATKFRGKAASWWLQVKATRLRAGKGKIRSWEKLQKLLKSSFLPYNFDRTMFTRLQNLRQGSRTVDDYAEEFSLLLTRNEIYDNQMQLVSRFIGGLRPQIQNALSQFDHATMAEAHRRVVAFEQQFRAGSASWASGGVRNRVPLGTGTDVVVHQGGGKELVDSTAPLKSQVGGVGDDQNIRRSSRPNVLRCYS